VFTGAVGLSVLLAVRVMRPLRQIDRGLRRLSIGDYSVAVPAAGTGQVARLGRAFNEMIAAVRESRERDRESLRRERLAALGRLAAGVAHDVRNPLHSMGLVLGHLRRSARPEDPRRAQELDEGLGLIGNEIRRLDRLVAAFLSFARGERQEPADTDLGELVRQTVTLVSAEARHRGVEIAVDLEEGLPAVPLHAEAMRSAILNLVLNAFEAMPDGGRLGIRGRVASSRELVLEVEDSGQGIAPEERERVFEFAYSGRAGGSGLGLAMVRHVVVDEHGGRLELRGEPGRGTTFALALPLPAAGQAVPP